LPRHYLLKTKTKVFVFTSFDLQFPIVAAGLAHLNHQICFAGSLKTKIEVIAHRATVDLDDSIVRL